MDLGDSFSQYQMQAERTATYPNQYSINGLLYTTLGLAGEAGEVANKVKKILRDDDGLISNKMRETLIAELGDVLWYIAMVSDELNYNLSKVAETNLNKLSQRKSSGTLKGDGDYR